MRRDTWHLENEPQGIRGSASKRPTRQYLSNETHRNSLKTNKSGTRHSSLSNVDNNLRLLFATGITARLSSFQVAPRLADELTSCTAAPNIDPCTSPSNND
jgi:hypothetical protein